VIYMPGRNYATLAAKLQAAELSGETPAAIISRATTPQQRTHVTTIGELQNAPQLPAPTLLVVGEVVRHADSRILAPAVLEREFVFSNQFPALEASEETIA